MATILAASDFAARYEGEGKLASEIESAAAEQKHDDDDDEQGVGVHWSVSSIRFCRQRSGDVAPCMFPFAHDPRRRLTGGQALTTS